MGKKRKVLPMLMLRKVWLHTMRTRERFLSIFLLKNLLFIQSNLLSIFYLSAANWSHIEIFLGKVMKKTRLKLQHNKKQQ